MPLTNFATVFRRSRRLAHRLARRCYGERRARPYRNYYGYATGVFGISDCYEVWDRWFGPNHYFPDTAPSADARRDLRDYAAALVAAYDAPLLAKNNRNALVIPILAALFPKAFFVVSRRDPVDVVASVLRANEDFFGDSAKLWGLKPRADFPDRATGDPLDLACRQQVELEAVIGAALAALPPERYALVDYDAFCAAPRENLDSINRRIWDFFGSAVRPLGRVPDPVAPSRRLDDAGLRARIAEGLEAARAELGIGAGG